MNEALFQFIWANSLYQGTGLKTTTGEPVTVMHCGMHNKDAGPDFLETRVRIGNTVLAGNAELHLKSSDWMRHGHSNNAAYKNLVLHVVYDDDMPGVAGNVPVLELKGHIPENILPHYYKLMNMPGKLPCTGQHEQVRDITKEGWLTRMLAERWEQKLQEWDVLLENSADDWRNLLYWRMAANFGFKTNATPFLMLARSLPLNILARHKDNIVQLEALLFGQAGMLGEMFTDEYPAMLQNEYGYLRKKYSLEPIAVHLWKFLRMRPANFPTVRIAQFAALLQRSVHLFSQIVESHAVKELEPLFDVTASSYWDTHFRFDDAQEKGTPKAVGKASIQNIIINTVAPIQFLYATHHGDDRLREQALQLLEAVPAEKNNITTLWQENGWDAANAAQSQALIQLYNQYCSKRRCLECTIGLNIIRRAN